MMKGVVGKTYDVSILFLEDARDGEVLRAGRSSDENSNGVAYS